METFWQDLRYGLRMLKKSPGFTGVAVLALALGIGANTSIFSALHALVLRPLNFEEPDRLVQVWESDRRLPEHTNEVSAANFLDWRQQNTLFEDLVVYNHTVFNLSGEGEPERLEGARVTAGFFSLLRVQPILGRTFLTEEMQPGRDSVVLLSHGFWQRRFGGQRDVLGRSLSLNGRGHTVVGVLPDEFHLPHLGNAEIWAPRTFDARLAGNRQFHWMYVLGRLKTGIKLGQARAEMDGIARRLEQQYPQTNAYWGVRVVPLSQQVASFHGPVLKILMGAVGFVLLIACANVANLLLARATGREREVATRTALGASRARIVRQLLTESTLLAALGGIFGLLIALWGTDLLQSAIPGEFRNLVPRRARIPVDGWVLAFNTVVVLLSGLLFGLAPAVHASRANLSESLKEGGRTSEGARHHRLRNLLVVAEVALAVVLLAGAGLLMRSFLRLQDTDPGFRPDNILTLQLDLPSARYREDSQVAAFYRRVLERIGALPSVTRATAIDFIPFGGSNASTEIRVAGRPAPAPGEEIIPRYRTVVPGFFEALRIPLRGGRTINERDVEGAPRVVVLSEALAQRLFPGEDPLGKRVILEARAALECVVVGVVGNIKHSQLSEPPQSQMYLPHAQEPSHSMFLMVQTAGEPAALAGAVRAAVWEVDKDQPLANILTMHERVALSLALNRMSLIFLGVFAAIALALAAVGIYGVMSYAVEQRTHEIGVRVALGAQADDLMRLVVGQGMLLTVAGLGLGMAGALGLFRLMANLLFEVSASDPATFASVSVLLGCVAFTACYVPARRATRVDPMVALRYE